MPVNYKSEDVTSASNALSADPRYGERANSGRALSLRSAMFAIRYGPFVILFLLAASFAIASPHFLSLRNIQNIGVQSAVVGVLALGQLLVIIARGIDLSVGSVLALSGCVAAILAPASGIFFVAICIVAGSLVGALNGGLITVANLPQPLIVTVATMGIARGAAQIFTGGHVIAGLPPLVSDFGNGFIGPMPLPIVMLLVVAVVFVILTSQTKFGRWLYAVGGNPEAARKLGVPVNGVIFTCFVLCGLTAGLAGIITAGRTDAVTPVSGMGVELYAITAVVIGGASLYGGRGSVWNVLVGALIIGVIRNGLDLMSVEPFYQTVSIGILILIALQVDVTRGRLEQRLRTLHATEHLQ